MNSEQLCGGVMLNMHFDPSDLERGLSDVEKRQLPVATMWALNDTAKDILEAHKGEMDRVFDRPTRFTKNAFMVWRATKSTLTAEVKERPSVGSRHYLKTQESGGVRAQTGLERLLDARLPYEGSIAAVIPAAGAKLNSFGNWSPGERNKVLSAVQAQRDTRVNSTAASKARRKSRIGYFVPKAGSKLSAGVWKRNGKKGISKILHFTTAMPDYSERLRFYPRSEETFDAQFPVRFTAAFQKAMDTAR